MTNKFTTLLLITLMLALPLRAVAGVTMAGCAGHHDPVAMDMQEMADMDNCHHSAGHDQPRGQQPCHDGADIPIKHAGGSCSACGDCCVGVLSLPAVGLSLFNTESPSVHIAFLTQPYAGFQPEGPDRPPRNAVL